MSDRPCTHCIWRGVDGCTSWDCEPITRSEVRKWLKDGFPQNEEPVRRGENEPNFDMNLIDHTNADHIRAMSDEELAEWTNYNCHCPPPFLEIFCPYRTGSKQTKSCQVCWLDWLREPVGGAE